MLFQTHILQQATRYRYSSNLRSAGLTLAAFMGAYYYQVHNVSYWPLLGHVTLTPDGEKISQENEKWGPCPQQKNVSTALSITRHHPSSPRSTPCDAEERHDRTYSDLYITSAKNKGVLAVVKPILPSIFFAGSFRPFRLLIGTCSECLQWLM